MALVVGHSQAKYLDQYFKSGIHVISVHAFPGFKTHQIWNHIEDIVTEYKVIAILLGANDITGNDHRTIVERFQDLCESIHSVNPSAKILLSPILPRKQNGSTQYTKAFIKGYNRMAESVNFTLTEVCSLFSWLDFINISNFTSEHLSQDGLHLSFTGTNLVATTIESAILSHYQELTQRTQNAEETGKLGDLVFTGP